MAEFRSSSIKLWESSPNVKRRSLLERALRPTGSALGTPVFSWIRARERRTQTYAFFLAEIPLGYKGVAGLRIADGKIVISERETGKTISLTSGRTF